METGRMNLDKVPRGSGGLYDSVQHGGVSYSGEMSNEKHEK
jgi:hypothetical protein